MLNLYPSQQIQNITVFNDNQRPDQFYLLPDQPRFRVDDVTKKPVFKFVKYKNPVTKPDGSKGGGFLIFDSSFTVSDDKLKTIQDQLNSQLAARGLKDASGQPLKAKLGTPTFVKGSATITILDTAGALVEKIEDCGKPSLFGSMICACTAELSPEGATLVEALLKGSGGFIQVVYDLSFAAVLPPITGRVWFYASKFYSFYQSIDKDNNFWGSNPTENQQLRESFINSQAGGVFFDFSGMAAVASDPNVQKLEDSITNWGWSQIDDAVKTAILPDIKAAEDRGDDGQNHIVKYQTTWESSSFNRYFSELMGITFETPQQGTLPSIADMGFKLQDFMVEVDLNDPFFAQINTSVAVNADFDKFGIDSVDVQLKYDKINPATIAAFHFKKPDDIGHFVSDTANGNMKYTYSFSVNYKDQSKAYQAPVTETDQGHITVNANDLGILYVDLMVGSIDFTKTPQVQVAIKYPDPDANGNPVSRQFNFDKDHKSEAMVAVILKPVTKPYQYQITYVMADGTQYIADWKDQTSTELYINSPFVSRTYSFLAEADFANTVDNIFLKMKYIDAANKIEQDSDFLFTAANRTRDWAVTVLNGAQGQIVYSGVINYKDHTNEDIPETTTTKELIEFGPPNQVIVTVAPDPTMIDFTKVKLVKLNFEYADPANKIDIKKELVVKQGSTPQWTFYARDPNKTSYTYSATYYMAANPPGVVQIPASSASDTDLVLMMPS